MLCSCTNWVTSSFQQTGAFSFVYIWSGLKRLKVYPLFSYLVASEMHCTSTQFELIFFSLVFSSHFLLHLFPIIIIRHSSMILSWNKFGMTVYLVIIGWWGPDSKCWRTREADRKTDKGERSLFFFLLQMLSLGIIS